MKYQLAHPYCTHCAYDLTGLPESEDDHYKCPECGERTSKASANRVPWYLNDSRSACLLATWGPGLIIGMAFISQDLGDIVPMILPLGVMSLIWICAIALILTQHYRHWVGPKQPGVAPKLFLRIMLGSLLYLVPMSLFWWMISTVLIRGAFNV